MDEPSEQAHGLAVDDGKRGSRPGRDGGDGASAPRACLEVREPCAEEPGLLRGIVVRGGGPFERLADLPDEGKEVVAAGAVCEEPVGSAPGLLFAQAHERFEGVARLGAERLGEGRDEGEVDAVVGDAPCDLREGVGLVEEDGLARGAEHAPVEPAVGEHQGVVGEDEVRFGGRTPSRLERGGGLWSGSQRHAQRVRREPRGHEHAVVLGLGEGGEGEERVEGGPGRAVAEALARAVHSVVVDELTPPGPRRDGDGAIAEGLERPAHPGGVLVEDLAREVVREGRERRAVRACCIPRSFVTDFSVCF